MPGSAQALAVDFQDVVFGYSREEVLHEITFSVRPGEIVGLLGPNGAGKSTTIKIIAGILTASGGSVRVLDEQMPQRANAVKQRIGYVPETALLFESLTGQEYLELCGRLHDLPEDLLQSRIAAILEAFQLVSDASSRLDAYSKGMRQKILIGAALLHKPELLLLDEPLSGLDVNSALMVKELLAALAAERTAVLYSSHVLDVVERVCDRVLIIHQGRLIASGTTETLKSETGQATLEDVFRSLTDTGMLESGVTRIIEALRCRP